MTTFLQLVVIGLSTGSAFALVGMSLVLVYRTTGIVNFAQGVFVVMGGLFTFQLSDDMPLALAALVSILIAAFAASILAVVAVGFRRPDDKPCQHHHHARRRVPCASPAAAQVRRHPPQLSRHLRSRLERRRSPHPAAVCADRGRGTARGDRSDPLSAPDDRRPGAGRLRGLPSRRRARGLEHPLARCRRVRRRGQLSARSAARCWRRATR